MNRYKTGRPSQATATTLCQKCLKRGHYSYECTAAQQDRPYVSRPSRTQQLSNPKLVPKIVEAAPETKPSTKDEYKSNDSGNDGYHPSSSYNSDTDSVSTISTGRSRSRFNSSSAKRTTEPDGQRQSRIEQRLTKRRRQSSDTSSIDSGHRRPHRHANLRRRRSRRSDPTESPIRRPESSKTLGRAGETKPRSRSPVTSRRSYSRDERQRSNDRRASSPHRDDQPNSYRELSPYSKRVALMKST